MLDIRSMPGRLSLVDNDIVNTLYQHQEMKLRHILFLPLSLSPSKIKSCVDPFLQRILLQRSGQIPLIKKTALAARRQELKRQFTLIQGTAPVEYCNGPIALDLARPLEGHDKGSIFHLSPEQRKMMSYILERQDYYSQLKLVRCVSDKTMHSVVSTGVIAAGTVVCEYGGTAFLGAQLSAQSIGGSGSSYTWTILDHCDARRSVLLCPSTRANLSRFINGVRDDEQHLANLAVRKVLDDQGRVRIVFLALYSIEQGEHLFYYYGGRYATTWSIMDNDALGDPNSLTQATQEFHGVTYLVENLKWEDISNIHLDE